MTAVLLQSSQSTSTLNSHLIKLLKYCPRLNMDYDKNLQTQGLLLSHLIRKIYSSPESWFEMKRPQPDFISKDKPVTFGLSHCQTFITTSVWSKPNSASPCPIYPVSIVTGSGLKIPAPHAHTGHNSDSVTEQRSNFSWSIVTDARLNSLQNHTG